MLHPVNRPNSNSVMESGSMKTGLKSLLAVAVLAAGAMAFAGQGWAEHTPAPPGTPAGHEGPMIYVHSTGLLYRTIVLNTELPLHGDFQQLYPPNSMDAPSEVPYLSTDVGPGEMDYRGGRWWSDENGNGEIDEEDTLFNCPLVGKGQTP
jgi:hypothetical protein